VGIVCLLPTASVSDSTAEREPAEAVGLEVERRARPGDRVAAPEQVLQGARLILAEPRQVDARAAPGEVVDRHDRPALPVAAVGEDRGVSRGQPPVGAVADLGRLAAAADQALEPVEQRVLLAPLGGHVHGVRAEARQIGHRAADPVGGRLREPRVRAVGPLHRRAHRHAARDVAVLAHPDLLAVEEHRRTGQ
jgi:hypothetical protein